MRKELQYAFDSRIEDFGVTLSAGVSLFPTERTRTFQKSDKCLTCKRKGRNRFITYNESSYGSLETAGIFIKFLICPIIQNICHVDST